MTLRRRGATRHDRVVVLPRADAERGGERLAAAGGGLAGGSLETLRYAGRAAVGPLAAHPREPRGGIVLQVFGQLETE